MKKFFYKIVLFIILFCVILNMFVYGTNKSLKKLYGPTTGQQIQQSFKDVLRKKYNCIILGNSRMYRGVNPSILIHDTYNFSHDNDSFNQEYYKLVYLKENNNLPNIIVLGVDYFQFSFLADTRNYIYSRYFSKGYTKDFNKPLKKEVSDIFKVYQNQFKGRVESLFKESKKNVPYLKENGQYIYYGVASKNDKIKRNSNILKVQLNYFEKILDLCEKENITVFLVIPPTRNVELSSYTNKDIENIDKIFKNKQDKKVYYLNYSTNKSFNINDYQDVTHLNIEGADKFTKILSKDINKIINLKK